MLTKLAQREIDFLLIDLPREGTYALVISPRVRTPFEEAITLILNEAQVKRLREILAEGGKPFEKEIQNLADSNPDPGTATQA